MKRMTRFYQGEQGRIVWHSPDNRAIAEFNDDGIFETRDERIIGILQNYKYKSETILMDDSDGVEEPVKEVPKEEPVMSKPEVPKEEPEVYGPIPKVELPTYGPIPEGGYSEEVIEPEMEVDDTPQEPEVPKKKKTMKRGS